MTNSKKQTLRKIEQKRAIRKQTRKGKTRRQTQKLEPTNKPAPIIPHINPLAINKKLSEVKSKDQNKSFWKKMFNRKIG